MGLSVTGNADDGFTSRPSHETEAELDVLYVDALDLDGDVATSTYGGNAKALREAKVPIDVDDPASWATNALSFISGSETAGPPPQLLKVGSALGVVLFDQKKKVREEEAKATHGSAPAVAAKLIHKVPSIG